MAVQSLPALELAALSNLQGGIHAYRRIPDPDRVDYTRCVLKPHEENGTKCFCKSLPMLQRRGHAARSEDIPCGEP